MSIKRQIKKFWKEYREGKEPDWIPIGVTIDGRSFTDPNCLIRTPKAQKHLKEANDFFEKYKGIPLD